MAKNVKEKSGKPDLAPIVVTRTSSSSKTAKTAAASALTQRPSKQTTATSQRVIKDTSDAHRDALKRLADR